MASEKKQTAVGAALVAWGEAVELVEAVYAETIGEVTDEVQQAEAWAEITGAAAVEHLARFRLYLDDGLAAIKREADRLEVAKGRIQSRIKWAEDGLRRLLEEAGRKSWAVGAYKVRMAKSPPAVLVTPDFDVNTAPDEIRKWKPLGTDGVGRRPLAEIEEAAEDVLRDAFLSVETDEQEDQAIEDVIALIREASIAGEWQLEKTKARKYLENDDNAPVFGLEITRKPPRIVVE